MADLPWKVQIETFLGCNARCTYCTIHQWERKHGQMRPEVFERILEQITPLRSDLKVVSLYMDGEPMMDLEIERRVERLKANGLPNIGFASNGSLMTQDRARHLMEAGMDWISFSFDSLNRAIFEKNRLRLSFEKVFENIKRFIELRNSGGFGTKVILRYFNTTNDPQDFAEYKRYWSSLLYDWDEIQNISIHNWGHGAPMKYGTTLKPCQYVFNNVTILRDGTVPLCCVDYNAEYPFGNIMQTPLLEIWNSSKWKIARSAHAEGRRATIGSCGTCNVPELLGHTTDSRECH